MATGAYLRSWEDAWHPEKGDVHFYDMDPQHDAWDPSLFPRAKFVSEFGFQSFASFAAYSNQSAPADWSRNSSLTAFRRVEPARECDNIVMSSQRANIWPAFYACRYHG